MKDIRKTAIISIIAWIYFLPALSYAGLSRPLQAHEVSRLEENVRKNPKNKRSREFLADHYSAKKNWKNVIRVLAPISESANDKQLALLVKAYIETKDSHGAEVLVKAILSKDTADIDTALLLVKIYNLQAQFAPSKEIKDEKVKSSIKVLKAAQNTDPENKKVYDLWLETLESFVPHFQYDALIVLERMGKAKVRYRPKHYSSLCRYNYLAGYTKQALESCKEATQRDEKNPVNWIYLGKSHISAGEKNRGQRMLASVGKKYAHSEEALWATANMYQESKDLVSAYDFYKKASQHKDSKPRDFLGLAVVAFELKKYQEALDAFRKHCSTSKVLDHEFRRASGYLKNKPYWQKKYRSAMQGCND